MKHFFPFLTILISFCVFFHTVSIIPVSAQQHDSFATAQFISMNRSVSVPIPAYDSVYFYFYSSKWQNTAISDYQIILSDLSSLTISLYDDQGTVQKLATTVSGKSRHMTCSNVSSDSMRYFLVLHNKTKQDMQTELSVYPVTDSGNTTSSAPKSTKTPNKSKKKTQTTAKPRSKTAKTQNTAKPNSKTAKAHNTAKPNSKTAKAQTTATPRVSSNTSENSATTNPQSANVKSSAMPKEIPKLITPTPNITTPVGIQPSTTPDLIPANPTRTPSSRSFLNLSTHFYRMSTGYSIATTELLHGEPYAGQKITYENLTPEYILLQNSILYAKSPGLAVLKIVSPTCITSCTIYIQETTS